jgi:hypothetical protein
MSESFEIMPPSWRTAVTIYVEVLQRGDSEEGKRAAREELLRLADIVDAMNAEREPEPEIEHLGQVTDPASNDEETDSARWRAERRYQNAAERDELDLY